VAILRWRRRTGWAALAVAVVCIFSLFILVGTTALDKNTGDWAKAFLFLLGVVAVVSTLLATDEMPWRARRLTSWLQPRPVSALFLAVFLAFGVMTDALSLFEPRPAIESRAGSIESGVNQIKGDMRRLLTKNAADSPAASRVAQRLPGLWGEPGCAVAYRFRIEDQALIVDAERRPAGAPPYRLIATITGMRGDVLEARGEEPAAARGLAATFTYVTNGATERLGWDDQVSPVPLELDRCA